MCCLHYQCVLHQLLILSSMVQSHQDHHDGADISLHMSLINFFGNKLSCESHEESTEGVSFSTAYIFDEICSYVNSENVCCTVLVRGIFSF